MESLTAGGRTQAPQGLRQVSKARRRALIQRTAMRLFAERGYDAATLAEIAAAAKVAPRTVTGYFPSKADLALSHAEEIAGRVTEAFTSQPGSGFFDVLEGWLREEESLLDSETAALALAMYDTNPSLRALGSARVAEAFEVSNAALVAEVGRPADDPMMMVCSTVVPAALAAYLRVMAEGGATDELRGQFMSYLRVVIDAVR
jgi:AcrR family transcriptional regulator